MKIPRDLVTVPHGGFWEVRIPKTGHLIKEVHINNFIGSAVRHVESMEIDLDGMTVRDWILALWCQQHPDSPCQDTEKPDRAFTVEDLKRFASSMGKWVQKVAGGESAWVSQEEAERRAEICSTCIKNQYVACGWCGGPVATAVNLLGGRRTSRDDKLQSCEICLCTLRAKVHMPLDAVDNEGLEWPSWCWQK